VTYNFIIYNLFDMFYGGGIIVMVVVRVVDKKNGIVDMIWCVGLKFRGTEFKSWLEQKA